MQISVETTSGLERRMTIGLPAEKVDSEVDKRIAETARRVRLDGFRPGKVPVSEVRRRFGAGIRDEVVSDVMRNSFVEAITSEKLTPAGFPRIEPVKNEKGQELEFTATFEVVPEVEVADLSGLAFEKSTTEVTDADVEKMLENLQQQKTEYSEVKREAQDKDKVNIDFVGKVDGEAFDGGTAEGSDVVLGSGSMIPGFEDGIVGMKVGEEKVIDVTFPEDYNAENLKGKAATFEIKLNTVSEAKVPEINDEFIKSFQAKSETLEDFKVEIKGNMEREARQQLKAKLKDSVVDGLLSLHELEVPSALIADEIKRLKQQAVQQFGGQMDPATIPDDIFKDQADKRVRTGLIMNEVVKKFEIKADPTAVRAYIEEMASVYQDPQVVIDYYYNNQEQMQQIEAAVIEELAVEKVIEQGTVTESVVSYDEAVKREEPAV